MVDRIKQVMEHYEETPATFAEKLGVNRSNLTHLFSGRNQPSLEFAKKVLSAYPEVRTEWLIMGVGEMIKDPAQEFVPPKKTFIQTDLFEMDVETSAEVEDETTVEMEDEATGFTNLEEDMVQNTVQPVENKAVEPKIAEQTTSVESKNQNVPTTTREISNSRPVVGMPAVDMMVASHNVNNDDIPSNPETSKRKKVEKIIFFYDDDTFKIFYA